MATFYNISDEEMREFLGSQGFTQIAVPRTFELVFGKRVDRDNLKLTLRIYTGINPHYGSSRDVGTDAIRVTLFMLSPDGRIVKIGGSKRVHRVTNWKKNLQSRLDSWTDCMPKNKCSQCGSPMLIRTGKSGKFLGCSKYPECKNTE